MKYLSYLKEKIFDLYHKFKPYWDKLSTGQKGYVITGLAIALVLLWAFISAGVITHNFNRSMLHGDMDKQELTVASIILTETKDGQKFWEIFGETGTYSSDHKIANLNNVVGNFYKDNKVEMSFESSKGIYNEETQMIILYENVFVVLKDETSLKADKFIYDIRNKTLDVEGNVKINRRGSFNAEAQKAIIDSDYSKFKIIGKTISRVYH